MRSKVQEDGRPCEERGHTKENGGSTANSQHQGPDLDVKLFGVLQLQSHCPSRYHMATKMSHFR